MYIIVDTERMVFVYKHHDAALLSRLCHLECPNQATAIRAVDRPSFFSDYTELELQLLYKNTTQEETCLWSGDYLRAVLLELTTRMPEVQAVFDEVEAQCAYVTEKGEDAWFYVKGSTRPCVNPDLYSKFMSLLKAEDEIAVASKTKKALDAYYPNRHARETADVEAMRNAVPTASAPRTSTARTPSSDIPRGSVKEVVWGVADRVWQDAGSPKDVATVLKLRKSMMDILEKDHDMKRTNSSNALAGWMKIRI